jgi:hypothetical protein
MVDEARIYPPCEIIAYSVAREAYRRLSLTSDSSPAPTTWLRRKLALPQRRHRLSLTIASGLH